MPQLRRKLCPASHPAGGGAREISSIDVAGVQASGRGVRLEQGLPIQRRLCQLVDHCLAEACSINVRGGRTGYGLEALCTLVISMDNIAPETTNYVEGIPAVGDPLHYDSFIRTICDQYSSRF